MKKVRSKDETITTNICVLQFLSYSCLTMMALGIVIFLCKRWHYYNAAKKSIEPLSVLTVTR